jgi:hypothetical protein
MACATYSPGRGAARITELVASLTPCSARACQLEARERALALLAEIRAADDAGQLAALADELQKRGLM